MKFTVTQEIKDLIREATRNGLTKQLIKNRLQDTTGWKDTKCYKTIRDVQDEYPFVAQQPIGRVVDAENKELIGKLVSANQIARKDLLELYEFPTKRMLDEITQKAEAKKSTTLVSSVASRNELLKLFFDDPKNPSLSDTVVKKEESVAELPSEQIDEEVIINYDKYSYNKVSDHYIVASKKHKSGFIVLPGTTLRDMRYDYINGNTTLELSRKFSIPKDCVVEIFSKLGVTHDSSEVTDEELKEKDVEQLAEELLLRKRFDLAQKIEKDIWKETQANSLKWIEFKHNHYDPFMTNLKSWNPPAHVQVNAPTKQCAEDRAFVVGAFDWHIGAMAESRYLFKGRDWNIAEANKSINKYTNAIAERVANDGAGFGKCVFLMGGDLYNTLTGYTSNGTQLTNEVIKDTQFEAIMNLLVFFTDRLLEIFPKVECHFVRGNHGGVTDIPLAWAIKNYYHKEPRLTFDISSCRTKMVTVGPVLFLLDHGASDEAKAQVPNSGKAKEAYIQSLFLAYPDMLVGIKQKVFLMGDLHHFVQEEYNDFEFIMTGALPCGDQYSNTKNLRNRPRQNCIIVGRDGIESIAHIYFE